MVSEIDVFPHRTASLYHTDAGDSDDVIASSGGCRLSIDVDVGLASVCFGFVVEGEVQASIQSIAYFGGHNDMPS